MARSKTGGSQIEFWVWLLVTLASLALAALIYFQPFAETGDGERAAGAPQSSESPTQEAVPAGLPQT